MQREIKGSYFLKLGYKKKKNYGVMTGFFFKMLKKQTPLCAQVKKSIEKGKIYSSETRKSMNFFCKIYKKGQSQHYRDINLLA